MTNKRQIMKCPYCGMLFADETGLACFKDSEIKNRPNMWPYEMKADEIRRAEKVKAIVRGVKDGS